MMRRNIPCVEGKIKRRKGDLTGKTEIICFAVVKHVKERCELAVLEQIFFFFGPDVIIGPLWWFTLY